jgi:nifR3 family TIM-barrel protein
MSFWEKAQKPILALAPMEDVTDAAFRRIIAHKGRPDVTFCEFTSADGLVLADEKGQKRLRRKLLFSEIERPVVAQFFTSIPAHMEAAAAIASDMGFDGVDINMGCPDRAVEKSGCGSAMIKKPSLAREIIRAAKRGAGELPVSVKTRLGYNVDQLEDWLPELLAEEPAAVTIHARTRKEMSLVPARWERIARAVEIRDALKSPTLILGNGDVRDIADAEEKCAQTGTDGAMLGRAIFGNPWLFSRRENNPEQSRGAVSPQERIEALREHIALFDELLGDVRNFAVMKKHFKAYVSGWDNAKELRVRLMETNTAEEALAILSA